MTGTEWIARLFDAIDARDAKAFAAFLAPACVFRFGNMPPVEGRENVERFVAGFFESIAAVSHEVLEAWDVPGGTLCHGRVACTRTDGTVLAVPFANVLKRNGDGIVEYLIFADTSKLYAP